MTDDILRPFPHAVGPEKSLLSSMLQDPVEFIGVAIEEGLTSDHFYLPAHSKLFTVLMDFYHAGREIEFVSLTQALLDRGQLDAVGGPSAMSDIYTYAPNGGQFRQHAEMVKGKFVGRKLINLGHAVTEMVYDSPESPSEALSEASRLLCEAESILSGSTVILTRKELLRAQAEQFERRIRGEMDSVGLPTYPALDHHIRGLHPGRLYVIGAYPGGGKSTMSSEIVSALVLAGASCLYVPLEGNEHDAMTRMVIQSAQIHAAAYTDPKKYAELNGGAEITKFVMDKIKRAFSALSQAPLHICRPKTPTITHIVALIRKMHREESIKLAVVDYAQRIKSTGKHEGGDGAAKECSNALQDLAGELNIAIIVPSQLTEDGDTKHGKVWGEDADVVLRIVQDRNKESNTYKQHRFMTIDKDRQNGSAGNRVPLIFDSDKIRFVEGVDTTISEKPKFQR